MQVLGTLFIIFFIVWLIGQILSRFWPQIVMWLFKRHMRNQMYNAFGRESFRQDQQSYDPFADTRRQSQSKAHTRRRKKKIIDPEVGEYVEFEEVRSAAYSQTERMANFKPEPQIEDADWEEIK